MDLCSRGLSNHFINCICMYSRSLRVVAADESMVSDAVELANRTYESGVWSNMDIRARAKILNKIAEALREEIPRLALMEVYQTGRAVR